MIHIDARSALATACFTLVALLALAASPAPASAQSQPRYHAGPSLFPSDRGEYQHIESLSRTATALYVTGVVLHVGGAVVALGSMVALATLAFTSGVCSIGRGEHCRVDPTGPLVALGVGVSAFALGLIGIFVGVGFDVASGQARAEFERDHLGGMRVDLAPTEGGAQMTLALGF